eukprot:1144386-Pyramimonas_sp.AAC.1
MQPPPPGAESQRSGERGSVLVFPMARALLGPRGLGRWSWGLDLAPQTPPQDLPNSRNRRSPALGMALRLGRGSR